MYVIEAYIFAYYITQLTKALIFQILSIHVSVMLPCNALCLYFAHGIMHNSILYTLGELLLYAIPYITLKYSPEGEGKDFSPFPRFE